MTEACVPWSRDSTPREITAIRSLYTATREKLKQHLKTQYSQKQNIKIAMGLAWWSSG